MARAGAAHTCSSPQRPRRRCRCLHFATLGSPSCRRLKKAQPPCRRAQPTLAVVLSILDVAAAAAVVAAAAAAAAAVGREVARRGLAAGARRACGLGVQQGRGVGCGMRGGSAQRGTLGGQCAAIARRTALALTWRLPGALLFSRKPVGGARAWGGSAGGQKSGAAASIGAATGRCRRAPRSSPGPDFIASNWGAPSPWPRSDQAVLLLSLLPGCCGVPGTRETG